MAVTHVGESVREVNKLLESTFLGSLEEQKRLQLLATVQFVAFNVGLVEGDLVELCLLTIEVIAWTVLVEIKVGENAEVGQVVAIAALMKNFTEERYELELVVEIERLREWKILIVLIVLQVFEEFTSNAIFATIIFISLHIT